VVAEGVENAEQLRFLRAQHCDAAQGYFLYRPLRADQVAEVLKINQRNRETRVRVPA
jgi:EAL domain-containing protein (putative c-di-GMP-specific phosphodiesterase class I)